MAARGEAPYDPYIPAGGAPGGASRPQEGNQRTAALQAQIDDTVGVMRENINKVTQRGENLESLEDKTTRLGEQAHGFRVGANRVRKDMWWKNLRMKFILAGGILALILVIVIPVAIIKK